MSSSFPFSLLFFFQAGSLLAETASPVAPRALLRKIWQTPEVPTTWDRYEASTGPTV